MLLNLHRRKDALILLSLLVLLSFPALVSYNSLTRLEVIQERGVLRLATRNTPSDYYLDKGEPSGFEYELAQAFANDLGVRLELQIPDTLSDMMRQVRERSAHLAAAGLAITPQRLEEFSFTEPYMESAANLIYRITQGKPAPKSIEDLVGKHIRIIANSSHSELMRQYQQDFPELRWEETDEYSINDLLEQVHNAEIDYTIADSIRFDGQYSFFPGLEKAFALEQPQPIAWMLPKLQDGSMLEALNRFFAKDETRALIKQLREKYFERSNALNYFDTVTFKKDLRERLPQYEQYFYIAEQETDIDWTLLASVAYQESHWDPAAVSPTGVKGIMMLTNAAASEVGVEDRTDPIQSIIGGAHYLISVKNQIPDRIPEPDHTWMALAGYNVGFGHLEDARILTQRANKNPDSWDDVAEHLPLLTKEKYYSTVRLGYARGYEPVLYVSNIQKYIDLLRWEKQLDRIRQNRDAGPTDSGPREPRLENLPPTL
ncbi:membrane-bound lytic murein transglycosylase MltF [Marinobacterium rhizophilum]|uniref:Membrane-bound lytic murein transglycosylase F n=1 Tax=Marinobacterium rhizophilum TaxID=420402 RepID=A0ABY5HNY1_9GAMM|nr:membrane-bound lytic murein transglycosylase MltF [Marinobacterium rhizophilum]UTW14157.1 membrane-bound lytic murein transglycosylase MltF [Marinobacterium rhizophilum]